MPMPIIVVPEFANVPFAAGVPFMNRSAAYPPAPDPALMNADGANLPGTGAATQAASWGIFDQYGTDLLNPDSVLDFSFANERRISDYPQEQGAFASYNKVAVPYDARMTMTVGGSELKRAGFLATIAGLLDSLDLVDVVTPDRTYLSANVVHYDYERTASNGVSLLKVSIFLREIRSAPNPATIAQSLITPSPITNAQSQSAMDPVSGGVVQPQTPTTAQTQSIWQSWGEMNAAWGTQGE
jgi:hypothetical protein